MPKEQQPLREVVHENILNRIARRELALGEPLVASEIAEELGVSRTPVNEALRTLEAQGLVQGKANHTYRVAKYSPEEAWRLYEVREGLEMIAARAMAERADYARIKGLREIYTAMETAAKSGDLARATQYDFLFHRYIFQNCDNPFISAVTNANALLVMTKLMLADIEAIRARLAGGIAWVAGAHAAILAAIEARDPDAAERAVREHVRKSLEDVRSKERKSVLAEVFP